MPRVLVPVAQPLDGAIDARGEEDGAAEVGRADLDRVGVAEG